MDNLMQIAEDATRGINKLLIEPLSAGQTEQVKKVDRANRY